jgi:hypothetical protein
MAEYIDFIDMNLNDPNLTPHGGRNQRIEPGTYDFEITKAVFDQSRKGNRTLRLTAKVITEGSPMQNRTMVGTYVISDDEFARRRMKAIVEATGVACDAQGRLAREAFEGTRFTADVVSETFDDIDSRTGMPTTKEFTKWCDERPYEGDGSHVSAPTPPKAAAPTPPATTPRRPAAPANGSARARG